MSTSGSESRSGLVLELAEEFLDRYRVGQRPPLREYIERHPDLADEIREVFPAMAMMEKIALAAHLLGKVSRPSEAAVRVEMKLRLQEALNSMDALDREVLALRHFEHLSNAEAAEVLGIKEPAAGKRYLRALERLREILANIPGGMDL